MSETIYLTALARIAQVMPTTLRKNIRILLDLLEKNKRLIEKND